MKCLLLAVLLITRTVPVLADERPPADAVVTPADPFTGWHWFNEPKQKAEPPAPSQTPAPEPSALPDRQRALS